MTLSVLSHFMYYMPSWFSCAEQFCKLETPGDPIQSFPSQEEKKNTKECNKAQKINPSKPISYLLLKAKAFVLCIPLRIGAWAESAQSVPAPFLGRRRSVTNQRAQPWRRKPEGVSGGWSGPRGGGLRATERRLAAVLGCEGDGRCCCCGGGGGVKTAGMVGRENELSIHFVPGNCRLVEVKESSRGSRGNWGCRVGWPRSRRLKLFSMHFLPESELPAQSLLVQPFHLWEPWAAPLSLFTSMHTV